MRSRVRLAAGIVGALVALGAIVLLVGSWILLSTEWGLRTAWRVAGARLPEGVEVERVSGRLSGPLALSGIRYTGTGATVTVDRLVADWRVLPLRRRTLDVNEISVDGVRISLARPDTLSIAEGGSEERSPWPDVSLPIRVRVRRALVRDLEIRPAEGTSDGVVVDTVAISDLSFDEDLVFGRLVVASSVGDFDASGRLRPRGVYAFDIETEWAVPTVRYETVVGHTHTSGTVDSIAIAGRVTAPVAVEVEGVVLDPLGVRQLEASVLTENADLGPFLPDGRQTRLSADFAVSGVPDSLRASGTAQVTTDDLGPIDLEVAVVRIAEVLEIETVTARLGPTRMQAAGRIVLTDDGPRADLDLGWSALRWPLDGQATVLSDSGAARLVGVPDAYRIRVDADLAGGRFRRAHLFVLGRGTREHIDLQEYRVDALDGRLKGSGQLSWAPVPRWDLEVAARDVSTADVLPDTSAWHGRVSFDGRTRGSLTGAVVEADIVVDTLSGVVRDAAIQASGSGSMRVPLPHSGPDWDAARATVGALRLEWGPNRLFATGTLADSLALEVSASIPDMAIVSPEVSGSLEVSGRLSGSRAHPQVDIDTLVARGVSRDSLHIGAASLSGRVESRPGGTVDIAGLMSDVQFGAHVGDTIRIRANGTLDDHVVQGSVRSGIADVELTASGGVTELRWNGSIDRLTVEEARVGSWSLSEPTSVSVGTDSVRVERACLDSEPARLCATASWEAEGPTSIDAEIERLPGTRLAGLLPEGWSVSGDLGLMARAVVMPSGALIASLSLDPGSGRLGYPTADGGRALEYSGTSLSTEVDSAGARSVFEATLSEAGRPAIHLAGDVSLPDYVRLTDTIRHQRMRGTVDASVQDFGAVEAALTGVEALTGDLEVHLTLGGSVERPEFVGEARFLGGTADLPRLGLQLTDIEITARGRGLDGVTIEGGLRSGSGTLTVRGEVPVAPSAERPASMRFTGSRIHAVALPEVDVWMSPDVAVTASPDRIGVEGTVRIPLARVELSEIPATAVRPSRDVVFVGDTAVSGEGGPLLDFGVRVVLGDSVSFQGYGFSANPRGSVLVRSPSGGSTTGTGEITLSDGRYRAYGQDLTMERGRLLFAGGAIENPGLDIRASRTADDGVVAGLQVAGTLQRPEVTIFSEPAMMESEALAYIVLGRPLGTASTSEGSQVANAATSLGIREGNVLASRIGQRFGLEEVRVEAEGPLEEASLIAGKYLSPRLYVSYGVGLFEPISTFRLRYLLSGRWTLMAESGETSGIDLLYRIERGR